MEKGYKVSVLTVCKNAEKTIERAIKSVINQTYDKIEYIIVDGASTDGTVEVINKHRKHIAHFISEPDSGAQEASEKALRYVSGDFVTILCADDWYEKEAIELLVEAARKENSQIAVGGFCNLNKNGDRIDILPGNVDQMWYRNHLNLEAAIVKKSVIDEFGYTNPKYIIANDYAGWLNWMKNGVKIATVDKVILNFSIGGISTNIKTLYDTYSEMIDIQENFKYFAPCKEEMDNKIKELKGLLPLYRECVVEHIRELFKCKYQDFENKIAVWGTGYWGRVIDEVFKYGNISIIVWVDNNTSIKGKVYTNGRVITPEEYSKKYKSYPLFVAIENISDDMINQIEELGIKEYVTISELLEYLDKE